MMEFFLTQPYGSLEEMLSSAEVAVYKEDLERGTYEKYAIVSRIGNRYDLFGNKIDGFAYNPFYNQVEVVNLPFVVNETIEEKVVEGTDMKYCEIEVLIDNEIDKAISLVKLEHEKEIAKLKEEHAQELARAKEEAKAELIAKLNG